MATSVSIRQIKCNLIILCSLCAYELVVCSSTWVNKKHGMHNMCFVVLHSHAPKFTVDKHNTCCSHDLYHIHKDAHTHARIHIYKEQTLTQSSISLVCAAEMHILLLPSLIGVAGYPTTTTPRFRLKHSLLNALVIIIIKQ